MFFTSIVNIIYIIQRSLSNNINEYQPTLAYYIKENNASTKSKKIDQFQETYKTFFNSFILNYFSAIENRTVLSNYCSPVPPDLRGPIVVKEVPKNFSLTTNSSYYVDVKFGGHYKPKTCLARHKIAIIVPYRARWEILKHFLFHTHQILQRQQLDYRIYVCEQAFNKTFNKGIVMNGCFKEILKLQPDTPCFIMHDVDLLLIDDRNMYTCPRFPRHLSVAIDKFHFYLPYAGLVGGVLGKKNFFDIYQT
jgi:beta-1,4-galactosyltransferase 3